MQWGRQEGVSVLRPRPDPGSADMPPPPTTGRGDTSDHRLMPLCPVPCSVPTYYYLDLSHEQILDPPLGYSPSFNPLSISCNSQNVTPAGPGYPRRSPPIHPHHSSVTFCLAGRNLSWLVRLLSGSIWRQSHSDGVRSALRPFTVNRNPPTRMTLLRNTDATVKRWEDFPV